MRSWVPYKNERGRKVKGFLTLRFCNGDLSVCLHALPYGTRFAGNAIVR